MDAIGDFPARNPFLVGAVAMCRMYVRFGALDVESQEDSCTGLRVTAPDPLLVFCAALSWSSETVEAEARMVAHHAIVAASRAKDAAVAKRTQAAYTAASAHAQELADRYGRDWLERDARDAAKRAEANAAAERWRAKQAAKAEAKRLAEQAARREAERVAEEIARRVEAEKASTERRRAIRKRLESVELAVIAGAILHAERVAVERQEARRVAERNEWRERERAELDKINAVRMARQEMRRRLAAERDAIRESHRAAKVSGTA